MKQLLISLCSLLALCLFTQCKSTEKGSAAQQATSATELYTEDERLSNKVNIRPENENVTRLVDLLRTVPGIEIRGSDDDPEVTIRGNTSITGDNRPLYVVDNTPIGRDFQGARTAVPVQDIKSIRVLKGSQASLYGARGANGVIFIKTK